MNTSAAIADSPLLRVKRRSSLVRRKEHMAYSQRTKSLWLMARDSVVLISSIRPSAISHKLLEPFSPAIRHSPYALIPNEIRFTRNALSGDFATNRHEYCGLDSVRFRFPSWHSLDGHPVPPANCAQGYATPGRKSAATKKIRRGQAAYKPVPLTLRLVQYFIV